MESLEDLARDILQNARGLLLSCEVMPEGAQRTNLETFARSLIAHTSEYLTVCDKQRSEKLEKS